MKKIRVAIVINDMLVGGAQRLVANTLERMDRSRFDVTLITLFEFEGRDTMYHLVPDHVSVHRLNFSGFGDIRSWHLFSVLLRNLNVDVAISHLFFSNTVTRIVGVLVGYQTLAVEHNTYTDKTRMQILCDRLLSLVSARIVAVSPRVQEFVRDQDNLRDDQVLVIKNGIDITSIQQRVAGVDRKKIRASLQIASEQRVIITVGRLTPQKNYPLLIAGFARFWAQHPEYHLLVLGGGAGADELAKTVHAAPCADHIHLIGSTDDVYQYYAISEFFVSTARIEGLSMAHLEALASGLPLVVTKTAGSEEVLRHGHNGLFIVEQTPEGVATTLEAMCLRDLGGMGQEARVSVRQYGVDRTVRAYESLIEETVVTP